MGEFSAPAGRSAGVHVKMAAMTQEPRDEPLNAMENAGQPQYERADGEPAPRPPRRRFGHFVRGWVRQAWLNVQIWIPFLLNPFERRRMLRLNEHDRLGERPVRYDLDWTVELPQLCWKTAQTTGLVPCVFEKRLRSFERPLTILGAMFLGLMFVSSLSCLLGPWLTPTLYGTIVLLGLIVLFIKSWRENILLTVWSRPEHADDLACPHMVVHNDHLYIHLPSTELARAAATAVRHAQAMYAQGLPDARSASGPGVP